MGGFEQFPGAGGGGAGGFDQNSDAFPPEDDGLPLVPCPDCGRSFKEDKLERHMKICKKVNCKRKQFNSAANRLGDMGEDKEKLIANAQKIQKEVANNADKPPEKKKEDSKAAAVPAWKKKSLEFRAAMLAAKAAGGDSEAAAKAAELNKELKS